MRVGIVGGEGFVGSAFVRYLNKIGVGVTAITRTNYVEHRGSSWDLIINANGNSKKWLAEREPMRDFDLTVRSTLSVILDFKTDRYIHLSSIDVYNDVSNVDCNSEAVSIVPERLSNYGTGKLLAETVVRKYSPDWLIARLGGMVGKGLKKNSIYDLMNGDPLRVHPKSAYQYLNTDDVARLVWTVASKNITCEVFNLCGDETVRLSEVQRWPGIVSRDNGLRCEHYEINIDRIKEIVDVPKTRKTVLSFIGT